MPLLSALLSDAPDNFERVRDVIAVLLSTNAAEQRRLAALEGRSPVEWDIRVFTERNNPWGFFQSDTDYPVAAVNVWYEASRFDRSVSTIAGRQATDVMYNIDVVGYGVSEQNAIGHVPGDEAAAKATQKAARFLRAVLDSPINYKLGLGNGIVSRWVESIQMSEPPQGIKSAVQISAARIRLAVQMFEYAPNAPENTLNDLRITVVRDNDGAVLAESRYVYNGG